MSQRWTDGRYYVDLEEGFIWSRVTVWKDVRPAIGGLVGTRRFRKAKALVKWADCVAILGAACNP